MSKLQGICPNCKYQDDICVFDWLSGHTWYWCPKCNAKFDDFDNENEIVESIVVETISAYQITSE